MRSCVRAFVRATSPAQSRTGQRQAADTWQEWNLRTPGPWAAAPWGRRAGESRGRKEGIRALTTPAECRWPVLPSQSPPGGGDCSALHDRRRRWWGPRARVQGQHTGIIAARSSTQKDPCVLGEARGRAAGASGRHLDAARYDSPWQLLRLLWLAVVPVPCGPGERTTSLVRCHPQTQVPLSGNLNQFNSAN